MVILALNLGLITRCATNRLLQHHGRILSTPKSSSRVTIQPSHCYLYSTLTRVPTCHDCGTLLPLSHANNYLIQRRFRKKGKKDQRNADSDDEDDDDNDENLAAENPLLFDDTFDEQRGRRDEMKIDVNSLRLDAVSKVAFGMSRARIEEHFYNGQLFLNGELPRKKSVEVSLNDEIEIKLPSLSANTSLVKRFIISNMPDKTDENGRVRLEIQRWLREREKLKDKEGKE